MWYGNMVSKERVELKRERGREMGMVVCVASDLRKAEY